MSVETSLVVKISSGGAAQTVNDVAKLQKSLQQLSKETKDTRATAAALGKAFNLNPGDVEDLAKALAQAKAATEGAADAAGTYRDAMGRLRDANGKFVKEGVDGFNQLGATGKGVAGSLDSVFRGFFEGLGRKGLDVAIASVQALGQAIKDTAGRALEVSSEFDAAGAAVDTLGVDSDALAARLQGVAGELGNQASTVELLQGSYDIVSAGFTDVSDVAKIAEASVRGAVGGFSDFATVSDAATSVLNAYGKSAEEADSIIDKFIATQNAGKITVDQYAQQIGKLAPTAALAGVGIDELNGFIATATAQGVPVESAFAGLRQALANTLKPAAESAAFAKEIGINFDAAALSSGGLQGVLEELNDKGLDSAENLLKLFGSVEAVAAVAPSAGANISTLAKNIDLSANSAGNAASAFQTVADTVPGLQNALTNQLSEGFLGLGQAIAPVQAGLLTFASDLLTATVDGSAGLGELEAASERLRVVLSENPELAERLGEALATVADAGVKQIALLIDAITALVSEQDNIDRIAASIEDLATVITTAGQAARFILAIADSLISLKAAAEGIPVLGEVIDFNPVGPLANVKGLIDAFLSLKNVISSAGEFVTNLLSRFDGLAQNPVIKALAQQILGVDAATAATAETVEQATSSIGESLSGKFAAGTQAFREKVNEVGEGFQQVGDSAEGAADRTTAAAETIEDALKRLGNANKNSLSDLSTDAANARAALLEAGGDPAKLATLEAQTLKDRIQNNRDFLAELRALQANGGLSVEDAAAVADQIRGVDGQLASDRVSLAQQMLSEKKRIEKEAADAAKAAAEVAQAAAEETAKKQGDALKAQRDAEKEAAEGVNSDRSRRDSEAFADAQRDRQEGFNESEREADKSNQAEINALQEASQERLQAQQKSFDAQQQAAAEANQARLNRERDQGGREFDALGSEVDKRLQLAQADKEGRAELLAQFEEERKTLELRRKIEGEVLAQRGAVLAREDTTLSPLEQARADFEARLQDEAAAFQAAQNAEKEAFEASLAEQRKADEAAIAAVAEGQEEEKRQRQRDFEEEGRAIDAAFEQQQRDIEAAFKAEQRRLDEASAQRVQALLAAVRPQAIAGARRDGGPVKGGGAYLVGEQGPEIVRFGRSGHVYTARETAAIMGGLPGQRGLSVPSVGGQGEVVRKLDRLIAVVEKGRKVQAGPTSFTLNTPTPQADAIGLQMAQIRALINQGAL